MQSFTRRELAGASLASLSTLAIPREVVAAAQCVVGQELPVPNKLSVDCASKQNFQSFRKYPTYFGLAGVVSMAPVNGKSGAITAGSLFLFPWLKPKAMAQKNAVFRAAYPTGRVTSIAARPIPGGRLSPDEYFCRHVIQAPWQSFIGFLVDTPFSPDDLRLDYRTNVSQLADDETVGVEWVSSNLNQAWFGGGHVIPGTAACHGDAWRALIADGLRQASAGGC